MMDPRSFLESVAGYTRDTVADQSANAPVKIGTIDVAYSGVGPAKVKFDGESTTSVKGYAFLNSYLPVATDRVVLIPVGNTYIIVGRIDTTVNNLVSRVAALEASAAALPPSRLLTAVATAGIAIPAAGTTVDIPGCSVTFTTAVANVRCVVDGVFDMRRTATAGTPQQIGFITVDGVAQSGRQAIWRLTEASTFITTSQYWDIVLPTAGSHTIKLSGQSNGAGLSQFQTHSGIKVTVFG